MKNLSAFIILASICLHSTFVIGYDRRLQNANADFLNFEANNKKPTPAPALPNQANLPGGPIQPTAQTNLNPNPQPSNVRDIISTFNDRIADNQRQTLNDKDKVNPESNRNIAPAPAVTQKPNTPTTPQNRNPNVAPTVPVNPPINKNPSVTPTVPANPPINKNPSVTPTVPANPPINKNPGVTPTVPSNSPWNANPNQRINPTPGRPGVVVPPKENFPALPSGGSAPNRHAPPPTPFSYSQAVSGNKQVNPASGTAQNNANLNNRGPSNANPNPSGTVLPKPAGPQVPTAGTPTSNKPGSTSTASSSGPEIATDAELKEVSEALFKKDTNNPSKYVTINYQAKTNSFSKDDQAPLPLISLQKEVWDMPTISAMKALLDNYEQDTTVNEHVTAQEKNEENVFLDAVMATSVMRHLMSFLKDKDQVSPDPKVQKDLLKQIWFNMYSRGQGRIGSSGFEHIFLSEIKNNEVSGLHNWLYFYLEEEAKRANYLGYLKKVDFNNKGGIIKLHFSLKGIDKPVDSMFIGTSPELEMALYTLCFVTRADKDCPLSLGNNEFRLRTHTFRYRSKNMIGSAFPEI